MPERPPPLVFGVALGSAVLGLLGNWLAYREVETLLMALVIAVPAVAGFGWAVWGR